MHGISAHSALAIKRQRKRRSDIHKRRRRPSQQTDHYEGDNKVMGTITMFHVGAVFLVLAAFLMLGALLTSESKQETAELVGTGIICLIIGLFLVILNRFYGQKEEDDLANYVEQRLGRSRSGQRLYHEQESMQDMAGPSASNSMDSNMSREMSTKKWNKKKKNKNRGGSSSGIEETAVVNGGGSPKVKVDVVNEHNQYRNHHNATSSDVASSAAVNVTLDRITEEQPPTTDNQYHNQTISYVNATYDDNPQVRGNVASNNLYRVYDRETSYASARVGGAV